MRKRVWFRVLDRVERGIGDLTIRCVDVVRSSMLARMLRPVIEKLMDAMKSKVEKLMEKIGWSSAQKIAYLAVSWGNHKALNWAFDLGFAKYLTITCINTSLYKT